MSSFDRFDRFDGSSMGNSSSSVGDLVGERVVGTVGDGQNGSVVLVMESGRRFCLVADVETEMFSERWFVIRVEEYEGC